MGGCQFSPWCMEGTKPRIVAWPIRPTRKAASEAGANCTQCVAHTVMGHLAAIVQQEQSGFTGGVVASTVSTVDAIGIIRIAIAACTGARTSPALMKTANIWRTSFMLLASRSIKAIVRRLKSKVVIGTSASQGRRAISQLQKRHPSSCAAGAREDQAPAVLVQGHVSYNCVVLVDQISHRMAGFEPAA